MFFASHSVQFFATSQIVLNLSFNVNASLSVRIILVDDTNGIVNVFKNSAIAMSTFMPLNHI